MAIQPGPNHAQLEGQSQRVREEAHSHTLLPHPQPNHSAHQSHQRQHRQRAVQAGDQVSGRTRRITQLQIHSQGLFYK